MGYPTYSNFESLAALGNLIPVYREPDADLETPVSVYLKLRVVRSQTPRSARSESFLHESVEGGEQLARCSFIATNPARVLSLRGDQITIRDHTRTGTFSLDGRDPLDAQCEFVRPYQAVPLCGLPRFFGGAVGAVEAARDFVGELRVAIDARTQEEISSSLRHQIIQER